MSLIWRSEILRLASRVILGVGGQGMVPQASKVLGHFTHRLETLWQAIFGTKDD
jgi:hypothetical protein